MHRLHRARVPPLAGLLPGIRAGQGNRHPQRLRFALHGAGCGLASDHHLRGHPRGDHPAAGAHYPS
eukprot:10306404-Heterocapsa_arctica.AAC.1